MSILVSAVAWLAGFASEIISAMGYYGIVFLMTLESMVFPMPSELVMPLAGFLVSKGEMNFVFVVIASTIGSIIGSLLSYYIGKYFGIEVVKRFGKYFLVSEKDLIRTENWFIRGGEKTILIGRFIPIVRHIISIPAGIAKMNLKKFCTYTIIGATIWNAFLAWLGYLLGTNWGVVRQYAEYISFAVVALIVIAIAYFIYERVKKR